MTSSCTSCPINYWDKFEDHENLDKTVSWKEWTNLGHRPKVVTKTMSCEAALKELKGKMEKVKLRCFVKKVQSDYFEEEIYFAENYALISQDEIQSAHWSHDQVTVFTCCMWIYIQEIKPFIIVSNDMSHTQNLQYGPL